MRAFISDFLNKTQRTFDTLDAKAILCNKTWRVFSDLDEKELFIFMEDGQMINSVNGQVTMGTWLYIPANHALVLSSSKNNIMVHPYMYKNILAFMIDGTNESSFMLDETKKELLEIKSIDEIQKYIFDNLSTIDNHQKTNTPISTASQHLNLVDNNPEDASYLFGQYGRMCGDILQLDMRQICHESGNRLSSKCSFMGNTCHNVHCFSSDKKLDFTFDKDGQIDYLSYETSSYNELDNLDIYGRFYLSRKEVIKETFFRGGIRTGQYKTSVGFQFWTRTKDNKWLLHSNIPKREWLNKYKTVFEMDMKRYKNDLERVFCTDPTVDHFYNWGECEEG